jgi:hypothetical protein
VAGPTAPRPESFGPLAPCERGNPVKTSLLFSTVALLLCTATGSAQYLEEHYNRQAVEAQENEYALLVQPFFQEDPQGGWIVADRREGQLRGYHLDGSLSWVFGRSGDGPGEFRRAIGVGFLAGDRVIGIDADGRFEVFNQSSGEHLKSGRTPLRWVFGVDQFDDSTIVLSGLLQDRNEKTQVHLWSPDTDSQPWSVFPSLRDDVPTSAFATDVVGDTVFAVHGYGDSVVAFSRGGARLRAISIPGSHRQQYVTPPAGPFPAGWAANISLNTGLALLPGGDILLEYTDFPPDGRRTSILVFTREGNVLEERIGELDFHASDADGTVLLFQDMTRLMPGAWLLYRTTRD